MFTEEQVSQIFKIWNAEMRALKANKIHNYAKIAWTNVAVKFGAADTKIFKLEYYKSLAAIRKTRRALPTAQPYKRHNHHTPFTIMNGVQVTDNPFPAIFAKLGLTRTQQVTQHDVLITQVLTMKQNETRLYVFAKQTEQTEFKESFTKVLKLYKFLVEDVAIKAYDSCCEPIFITAVTRLDKG